VAGVPAPLSAPIRFSREVAAAHYDQRPVVALESSVLTQGLPEPANREAAARMITAVRSRGAVPAFTGIVSGVPCVGLEEADLARFLARTGISKVSARDLPWAMATGADGATTVAAALALCALAGVRVLATGGIGGVHRGGGHDESPDLLELSRTPVVTVCAGAKSILDLGATAERLETLGVTVLGYRTHEFPGFLTATTGLQVSAMAGSAGEIARTYRALRTLRRPGALLVLQSPLPGMALDALLVNDAVEAALAEARTARVVGPAVTPYLLAAMERATGGRALPVNIALLESNAVLAAEIAVALNLY
jgi:pseudouridine-5'-phosphate glycosidase